MSAPVVLEVPGHKPIAVEVSFQGYRVPENGVCISYTGSEAQLVAAGLCDSALLQARPRKTRTSRIDKDGDFCQVTSWFTANKAGAERRFRIHLYKTKEAARRWPQAAAAMRQAYRRQREEEAYRARSRETGRQPERAAPSGSSSSAEWKAQRTSAVMKILDVVRGLVYDLHREHIESLPADVERLHDAFDQFRDRLTRLLEAAQVRNGAPDGGGRNKCGLRLVVNNEPRP